ncbi:CDGSH iron-sulfur domain-containing protein [Silvibacterium acidisoli]|uniref:CDGSH iron-sulfur domain-containing protein n=1 Tax=Acidobacteriaceae bacterium ZG23-2 TaxID=2883246 RepID=UPI00406D0794
MFFRKKKERPNTIQVTADGPFEVSGDFAVKGREPLDHAFLCRCGASKNKPFCDGSHQCTGFKDDGLSGKQPRVAEIKPVGRMTLNPVDGGALLVNGPHQVLSAGGEIIHRGETSVLCRCGNSARKPFCDGRHAQVNFEN